MTPSRGGAAESANLYGPRKPKLPRSLGGAQSDTQSKVARLVPRHWDMAESIQTATGTYVLGPLALGTTTLQMFEATGQQGPHALVTALG